jgi:tellurite resistance protein TerC
MTPAERDHLSDREGTATGARRTGALGVARKVAVLVIGGTVLLIGVALIVLPGPAFLVIPAGLAILATEFLWARRLLRYGKGRAAGLLARARSAGGAASS